MHEQEKATITDHVHTLEAATASYSQERQAAVKLGQIALGLIRTIEEYESGRRIKGTLVGGRMMTTDTGHVITEHGTLVAATGEAGTTPGTDAAFILREVQQRLSDVIRRHVANPASDVADVACSELGRSIQKALTDIQNELNADPLAFDCDEMLHTVTDDDVD